jgi:hypothetical protein
MPLIVEDGTGVATANSYVTLEEADTYFETHPYYADNWAGLGTPDKENLLTAASLQLDGLINWRGFISSDTQGLGWPRTGVIDNEGRVIADNIVPRPVKIATFEMAMFASRGDPFAASASAGVERLKIDVIELQFASSTVTAPVPAAALLAVRGLGDYTLGTRVRRVLVG